MLAALTRHATDRATAWARRRQGLDARAVTLQRRRIYILPTRFGAVFAALVVAMLLGSLNYGASLGFALTFLLTGLGLVIMHHCHNNLLATHVRFAGALPVFAGQPAIFRITLANTANAPRYELELAHEGRVAGPVDVGAGHSSTLELALAAEMRGWLELPRFSVATRYPGSLFRAWTWMHMQARCLVYPAPAPPGRAVPPSAGSHALRGMPALEDSDFVGLAKATPADPPGRLAWKAYARTGELMVKQFSGGAEISNVLDFDALPDLDTEARLSQLARWCLDAAAQGRAFGLRLPTTAVGVGNGERHLHDCLQALALYAPPRP